MQLYTKISYLLVFELIKILVLKTKINHKNWAVIYWLGPLLFF